MFSMPPATATSMLPRRISCAAETMACAPEPQTRLTVRAGVVPGRIHLGACLHDIAHDHGFHVLGANSRARDRGADRHRAETGSRNVLERAAKGADRGANRLCENN